MENKVVAPSQLRDVIPRYVPTDIVNTVKEYMYPDIRNFANYIYEQLARYYHPLVTKDKLVDMLISFFLNNVGFSFADFLKNYEAEISERGVWTVSTVGWILFEFCETLIPADDDFFEENILRALDSKPVLEKLFCLMAYQEKFIKVNNVEYFTRYMNSLGKYNY